MIALSRAIGKPLGLVGRRGRTRESRPRGLGSRPQTMGFCGPRGSDLRSILAKQGDNMRGRSADLESYRRMIDAGYKPAAIRGRIWQIAQERSLPGIEVDRALKDAGSPRGHDRLLDFAITRDIDLDWLFFGDIRGLRRMKRLALAGSWG